MKLRLVILSVIMLDDMLSVVKLGVAMLSVVASADTPKCYLASIKARLEEHNEAFSNSWSGC
jgi:hypothetical protein